MAKITAIALYTATLLAATTAADFPNGWHVEFGPGSNSCPPWADNCIGLSRNSGSNGDDPPSSDISQSAPPSSAAAINYTTHILVAHAVLASFVFVIAMPSLAILLRLNLKNPIVLKIHTFGQILGYITYIAAAGLGIYLARKFRGFGIFDDPHPKLGLVILALVVFQLIFGAIHHSIYKKRAQNIYAGTPTKAPGRTVPGCFHIWLGRILIFLGIINGGLGIRLSSFSIFQTDSTSTKAKIAYGVVAAAMFLLYLFSVVTFEIRRVRNRNGEAITTYDESKELVITTVPK